MHQLRRIDPELHAVLDEARLALARLRTEVHNVRAMIDVDPEEAIAWGRAELLAALRELTNRLDGVRQQVIGEGTLGRYLRHEIQDRGRGVAEMPDTLGWGD